MRRDLIILPREMRPEEYDNYRMTQDVLTAIFKNSVKQFPPYSPVRVPTICDDIPESTYDGLNICDDIPIKTSRGNGVLATAQALYGIADRKQIKEIIEIIEENGYYKKGQGLYWHWFNNFCSRATHWLNIVTALEHKKKVTVLIKTEEGNFLTNIVAVDFVRPGISTSDSSKNIIFKLMEFPVWFSLKDLTESLVTAPWIWNV